MTISTILFLIAMGALIAALTVQYTPLKQKQQYALFAVGWIVFAVFWISRFEYYVFQTRSFVYLLVVPLSSLGCLLLGLSAARAIRSDTAIPSEYTKLTTTATVASIIYMPFTLINSLRQFSIEFVATQTYTVIRWVGITNVEQGVGPEYGYESALIFTSQSGDRFLTYIAPNCTGIGSMAIVLAILAITNLSVKKKVAYGAISLLILHILNLGRNVMIAVGFGHQWFESLEPTLAPLLGYSDPNLVSFFVVDKVLAQIGSAGALLLIFYIFLTQFPELQETLREVLDFVKREMPILQ